VSAKIDEAKAASDAIRAEIAVLNTQLDKIKAEREAANAKLDAMRAEQQEARSDIPGLMVEKKELWEVIQTLRDKQREIRVAFNEKWEEFKKQDKAWKGWFAQERKKRCAEFESTAVEPQRLGLVDSSRQAMLCFLWLVRTL
jgi:chromosome segregation ATPase